MKMGYNEVRALRLAAKARKTRRITTLADDAAKVVARETEEALAKASRKAAAKQADELAKRAQDLLAAESRGALARFLAGGKRKLDFFRLVSTKLGQVRMTSKNITIKGRDLLLDDLRIFPELGGKLNLGPAETRRMLQSVADEMGSVGFKSVRFKGVRVTGANVGKTFDRTFFPRGS